MERCCSEQCYRHQFQPTHFGFGLGHSSARTCSSIPTLTYDKASGIGTLYLNGTVVAQVDLGSFVRGDRLMICGLLTVRWICHRRLDLRNDRMGGLLDELSIYNRALSATEIR